jgi:hypothetical protein
MCFHCLVCGWYHTRGAYEGRDCYEAISDRQVQYTPRQPRARRTDTTIYFFILFIFIVIILYLQLELYLLFLIFHEPFHYHHNIRYIFCNNKHADMALLRTEFGQKMASSNTMRTGITIICLVWYSSCYSSCSFSCL